MPIWCFKRNPLLAFTDADLKHIKCHIDKAKDMWYTHYRDGGSAVIGAGIALWTIESSQTKPISKVIICSPGCGDGCDTAIRAMEYLHRQGIPVFFEYGTID